MTDEDLKALEELAKAATPGPWGIYHADHRTVVAGDFSVAEAMPGSEYGGHADRVANAEYIAAANPASVFTLIDRLRSAEARGKKCCERDTDSDGECPWHPRPK